MTGLTLTCLIPAYNEAPRIAGVLRAVAGHPGIAATLVIDDGSTDGTADAARAEGADVIATRGNVGKTAALALGLGHVRTSHVLLLDADLTGLDADTISALLRPVADGRALASVSLRGNAPRTWRMIGIDYISGERVIPMDLLVGHMANLTALPRFGFEVFLNRLLIARNAPVAIVPWPDVASPSKASKRGVLKGIAADARMIGDILGTIPPREVLSQIAALRHLARRVPVV
jgi:glycosyltransferase involved in cell wall biosynthesis